MTTRSGISLGPTGGWIASISEGRSEALLDPQRWDLPGSASEVIGGIFQAVRKGGAGNRNNQVAVTLLPSFSESSIAPHSAGGGRPSPLPLRAGTRKATPEGAVVRTSSVIHYDEGAPRTEYSATCSDSLLHEILDAAEADGVTITSITPADFAWAAAASEAASRKGGSTCICALELPGSPAEIRFLAVYRGDPIAVRRLPARATSESNSRGIAELAGWLQEIEKAPPAVLALGDPSFRETLDQAARQAGLTPLTPSGRVAEAEALPGPVAAAYAGPGPQFVPREVVQKAKTRRRRQVGLAAILTLMLLIGAGILETVGLNREISAIRDARSGIQDEVAFVLESRERVFVLTSVLDELNASRELTPRWTSVLTGISETLPSHTSVSQARMVGDSLFLELQGPDAASALDALGRMSGLTGFRASAPVLREVNGGNEITERFSAVARVSWADFQPGREESP